ncbi:MAG: hypothetical protein ACREQY_14315 [Candidatus Binatia bacterium]
MRRRATVALLTLLSLPPACAQSTKESWRESGRSWRESGSQFFRAIGRSIGGEGEVREEWKETGRDFGEAGKDTADAIGDSIQPRAQSTPAR